MARGPGCPRVVRAHPFGGGVIGNTAGSGPVIGGSSPPPRALAPSSSGLGRRPLKAVTAVRIRSGLLETQVERPGSHRDSRGDSWGDSGGVRAYVNALILRYGSRC